MALALPINLPLSLADQLVHIAVGGAEVRPLPYLGLPTDRAKELNAGIFHLLARRLNIIDQKAYHRAGREVSMFLVFDPKHLHVVAIWQLEYMEPRHLHDEIQPEDVPIGARQLVDLVGPRADPS